MFSHIMIGANDIQASKVFYDAVLGAMGHKPGVMDPKGRCFYFTDAGIFALTPPINGEPAMAARLALLLKIQLQPMPGTRLASRTAVQRLKILPAIAKVH